MSVAILTECLEEVRRFSLAGSDLAAGDKRLARYQEALAKAGEKVPVFGRIATSIEALVNGDTKKSPECLLTTATLLHAVLYTQGSHKVEGEVEAIQPPPLVLETTLASRRLKQLHEALTAGKEGRLEIVRDAWERGQLKDLRLLRAAVEALGDRYHEMADFIAKKVLPEYGEAILPLLIADGFDLKGGRAQARRLEVVAKVALEKHKDLFFEAAENGSPEVKQAAIPALEKFPDSLPILELLAKKGPKEVRGAALVAINKVDLTKAGALILSTLDSAAADAAILAARQCGDPAFVDALCEKVLAAMEGLKQKSPPAKDAERGLTLLQCLDGKQSPKVVETVLELWRTRGAIKADGFAPACGAVLKSLQDPRAITALVDARNDPEIMGFALLAAVERLPREEVFEKFSPLLKVKNNAYLVAAFHELRNTSLDPRWKMALFEHGHIHYVSALVTKEDEKLIGLLCDWIRDSKVDIHEKYYPLVGIVRLAPEKHVDLVFEFTRRWDRPSKKQYRYCGQHLWIELFGLLPLPPAKIEEFAAELKTEEIINGIQWVAAQKREEDARREALP